MRNTNLEMQSMRDKLANEIREIRKKGDSAREDAYKISSKIKDYLPVGKGSMQLDREAKGHYREAKYRLANGKKEILEKQEELTRLEFQQKYPSIINGLSLAIDCYHQLPSLPADSKKEAGWFFKIKYELDPILLRNQDLLNKAKQFLSPKEYDSLITRLNNCVAEIGEFQRLLKEKEESRGIHPSVTNSDAFYQCSKEISQAVLGIIEGHLDTLIQQIGQVGVESASVDSFNSLSSVDLLIKYGSAEQKLAGRSVLEKNIENLLNGTRLGYMACNLVIAELYASTSKDKIKTRIKDVLQQFYLGEDHFIRNNALDVICFMSPSHRLEIVRPILEHWQLDADKVLESFREEPQIITGNLRQIYALERQQPEISKFLLKEFGIRNFLRYPQELLQEQYKQFNNREIPYGVILYAVADSNGAFEYQAGFLEDLFKQIKDKYTLRIIESNSKMEIARSLIKLDRQYGKEHKIDFLIIVAHGTPDVVAFGSELHGRYSVSIEDLLGRGISRCQKFLSSDAPIVLNSCSTGQEQGIAQRLSEAWNKEVIAPDRKTSVESIKVAEDSNGKLKFLVKYRRADTMSYQPE